MSYPEHEKLAAISDKSQVIGEFLEWAQQEKGWHLAEWNTTHFSNFDFMMPIPQTIQVILSMFFNIDLDRLEKEKRAMLDVQRELNVRSA